MLEVTTPQGEQRSFDAPAVRIVDELIDAAMRAKASDIHIEPTEGEGRSRHRVDGILRETRRIPQPLLPQVISRVKLLAAMDISEKRTPQDGCYQVELHGRSVDARISSMPTIFGEKVVIRLLDLHAEVPSLEDLGMSPAMLARYRRLLHAPHGLIIVCGPTGSGKTTTLYGSLAERNLVGQHICTVEDPVEVRIPGIAQVQVHERAGLTFAAALRSFLRQDPNVIMIGETRDAETASVVMSAALSGQLVLTSLHASDAPRAIDRLLELGLKKHALAAALSGIVAQRLVRLLCTHCRRPMRLSLPEARMLGAAVGVVVHEASGCESCGGTGYRGRRAIFELLSLDELGRDAIARDAVSSEIATIARGTGYTAMHAEGARLVLGSQTSVAELRRVLTFAGQV